MVASAPSAVSTETAGDGRVGFAPPRSTEIATRKQLSRTKLAERLGIIRTNDSPDAGALRRSIVTRRLESKRLRRRKRLLIALGVVLAFFPPMWAVYLVGWLYWRSRPRQKSMRGVRKAVRALEKNQHGVALTELQDAHFLDPTNNDALYWLGMLLSRQGRMEEAEEALSIVAERVPGLPEVEASLVDAYLAAGDTEGAIYHAQRFFDVAPHDPDAPLKLADAFDAAGRTDLAIEALERAPIHKQTLSEGLMQVHYRLGTLYERQGNTHKALHHFKRVYSRDITFRDVSARVQVLEADPAT